MGWKGGIAWKAGGGGRGVGAIVLGKGRGGLAVTNEAGTAAGRTSGFEGIDPVGGGFGPLGCFRVLGDICLVLALVLDSPSDGCRARAEDEAARVVVFGVFRAGEGLVTTTGATTAGAFGSGVATADALVVTIGMGTRGLWILDVGDSLALSGERLGFTGLDTSSLTFLWHLRQTKIRDPRIFRSRELQETCCQT